MLTAKTYRLSFLGNMFSGLLVLGLYKMVSELKIFSFKIELDDVALDKNMQHIKCRMRFG